MRKFGFSSVAAALMLAAAPASANEFDALLSELNYGKPPVHQRITQAPKKAVASLVSASKNAFSMNGVPAQTASLRQSAQQTQVAAQAVGFHLGQSGGCADGGCADGGCADGGCASGGCASGNCVPHTVPNLPSSTLRQYWRSNSCNVNVWDGYRNQCRGSGKHARGECDCFSKRQRQTYAPAPVETGCATGDCGQAPIEWQQTESCDAQVGCDAPACDSPGCDTADRWSY